MDFLPLSQKVARSVQPLSDSQNSSIIAPVSYTNHGNSMDTALDLSPPFSHTRYRCISSIRTLQSFDNAEAMTRYRTPVTFRIEDGAYDFQIILTHSSGDFHIRVGFPPNDVSSMQIPASGFLVFEIMDNAQPHASPWIGCPSIGPFEHFIQASSLGIRFEWYDQAQDAWLSTTLHKRNLGLPDMRKAILTTHDVEDTITVWRAAMNIIQALKDIVYTDYRPNTGFYKSLTFGGIKVLQLQNNHLRQTLRWVQRPQISQLLPKEATWQDNFTLMVKQFSGPSTFLPSHPIPASSDINSYCIDPDLKYKSSDKCDFCYLSTATENMPCTPDNSSTFVHVCMLCSLFNRPCSFTVGNELARLWGRDEPLLNDSSCSSRYPTGPHRFLAYYNHRNQGARQVPEPREKALGLFLQLDLSTDRED